MEIKENNFLEKIERPEDIQEDQIVEEGEMELNKAKKERIKIIEESERAIQNLKKYLEDYTKALFETDISKLRHLPYFYKRGDWPAVVDVFRSFEKRIKERAKDYTYPIKGEGHFLHVINNNPKTDMALAIRAIREIRNPKHDSDDEKMKRNFDWLAVNKDNIDNLLRYLDMLGNDGNEDIVRAELSEKDGYLSVLLEKNYYLGKNEKEEKKLPPFEGSIERLKHLNFILRLRGWRSKLDDVKGIDAISCPIETKEEFEKAFDSLPFKEQLDKEKILAELFKPKEEHKMAA